MHAYSTVVCSNGPVAGCHTTMAARAELNEYLKRTRERFALPFRPVTRSLAAIAVAHLSEASLTESAALVFLSLENHQVNHAPISESLVRDPWAHAHSSTSTASTFEVCGGPGGGVRCTVDFHNLTPR